VSFANKQTKERKKEKGKKIINNNLIPHSLTSNYQKATEKEDKGGMVLL